MIQIPRIAADYGFLAASGQVWATVRAEIVMQWRRWGLWLAFAFATGLLILIFMGNRAYLTQLPSSPMTHQQHFSLTDIANVLTLAVSDSCDLLFGVVAALLVADRMRRDRGLGMWELQRVAPQGYARYVLGKFIGNYVAVLVPTWLGYMLCALVLILLGLPTMLLQTFTLSFILVFIPVFTAIVGLTLCLSSVLPVRIVQIGFPLLWIYANLNPLSWLTLNNTIFNPNGRYVYPIIFSTALPERTEIVTSVPLMLLNIAALILVAGCALVLTCWRLAAQQHREEEA